MTSWHFRLRDQIRRAIVQAWRNRKRYLSAFVDLAVRTAIFLSLAGLAILIVHVSALFFRIERGHSPSEWKEWYSEVEQVAHVALAAIGGAWVYQKFVLFRESAWNIKLSQSCTTIELNNNKRLLCLDICLNNIGKVKVKLNVGGKEGLVVALGKVPSNVENSELIADPELEAVSVLSRDVGYEKIPPIERGRDKWKWINVLRFYDRYYVLEPWVEYHEREYVVVDSPSLIYSRVYLMAVDGKSMRDCMVTKII